MYFWIGLVYPLTKLISLFKNESPAQYTMEQALRNCNFPKRDWFSGWYIGSSFCKATTQVEADAFQLDYELRLYFRNRTDVSDDESEAEAEAEAEVDNETDSETDVDNETEAKTEDETEDEAEVEAEVEAIIKTLIKT